MNISRRAFTGAVLTVPLIAAGCMSGTVTPASVASDVALIANGLPNALKTLSLAVPSTVTTALADLAAVASAISAAETTAAAQPLVQRVGADVLAVASAVLPLVPGGSVAVVAIQAAQVLIPAIETAVGLTVPVAAQGRGASSMSVASARLVLAGDAAR